MEKLDVTSEAMIADLLAEHADLASAFNSTLTELYDTVGIDADDSVRDFALPTLDVDAYHARRFDLRGNPRGV